MRKQKYLAAVVLATLSVAVFAESAGKETTIGRWCDRMIPNMPKYNRVMKIVITDSGDAEVRSDINNGSSTAQSVREVSGYIYEVVGSNSDEKYRIVASDGNLQLIDKDGVIRVASRLENEPKVGECGK